MTSGCHTYLRASWSINKISQPSHFTFVRTIVNICQRDRGWLVTEHCSSENINMKYKSDTSLNCKSLYWTANKISSFYLGVWVAKTTESGSSCISIYSHKSKRNWLMTCSCEKMVVYARHKSFSSFGKYPIGYLGILL